MDELHNWNMAAFPPSTPSSHQPDFRFTLLILAARLLAMALERVHRKLLTNVDAPQCQ